MPGLLAHEVAHYHWRGDTSWLDEGMSDVMQAIASRNIKQGIMSPDSTPCNDFRTVSQLPHWDPPHPCAYSLGTRLLIDLMQTVGEMRFREGMRDLNINARRTEKLRLHAQPVAGINELRAEFPSPEARAVIEQWFAGTGVSNIDRSDDSTPDAALASGNGRITELEVRQGTNRRGTFRRDKNAEIDVGYRFDGAILQPQSVTLTLVVMFEDGHPFIAHTWTDVHQKGATGYDRWLRVWDSARGNMPSGEYTAYLYENGQKRAETGWTAG